MHNPSCFAMSPAVTAQYWLTKVAFRWIGWRRLQLDLALMSIKCMIIRHWYRWFGTAEMRWLVGQSIRVGK